MRDIVGIHVGCSRPSGSDPNVVEEPSLSHAARIGAEQVDVVEAESLLELARDGTQIGLQVGGLQKADPQQLPAEPLETERIDHGCAVSEVERVGAPMRRRHVGTKAGVEGRRGSLEREAEFVRHREGIADLTRPDDVGQSSTADRAVNESIGHSGVVDRSQDEAGIPSSGHVDDAIGCIGGRRVTHAAHDRLRGLLQCVHEPGLRRPCLGGPPRRCTGEVVATKTSFVQFAPRPRLQPFDAQVGTAVPIREARMGEEARRFRVRHRRASAALDDRDDQLRAVAGHGHAGTVPRVDDLVAGRIWHDLHSLWRPAKDRIGARQRRR
ncbi:MAG: hypothetical protein U5K30_11935 [Acidimicrobiales bacterium]|nr:hypothetical protein [Acidimicrobiales bacterium]